MTNILVTGATGFIGTYLVNVLNERPNTKIIIYRKDSEFDASLSIVNFVFHLAGVIQTEKTEEFEKVNVQLTKKLCDKLEEFNNTPTIIFTSTYKIGFNTPYDISKLKAEEVIKNWVNKNKGKSVIFRLNGIFGKLCKPNYASVVATFCYNVVNNIPLYISNEEKELELTYIEDAVHSIISILDEKQNTEIYRNVYPSFKITLEKLAYKIKSFEELRKNSEIPVFNNDFDKHLYNTYLSYTKNK